MSPNLLGVIVHIGSGKDGVCDDEAVVGLVSDCKVDYAV
jgi:hypothetical protein